MGGEDEDEICRVCRSPSTPDQPLFFPCKCSGSMRYVHQDCLEEWLRHSRKRQCEICNYSFAFTPIYSERAPERISVRFFLSVLWRRLLALSRLYVRGVFAIIVWLVFVPYVTVWVWRLFFNPRAILLPLSAGSSALLQLVSFSSRLLSWRTYADGFASLSYFGADDSAFMQSLALRTAEYRRLTSVFLGDVFEGQIIASIAVAICLAFLCLKEYVVMNTVLEAQANHIDVPEQQAVALDDVPAFVPNVAAGYNDIQDDNLAIIPPPPSDEFIPASSTSSINTTHAHYYDKAEKTLTTAGPETTQGSANNSHSNEDRPLFGQPELFAPPAWNERSPDPDDFLQFCSSEGPSSLNPQQVSHPPVDQSFSTSDDFKEEWTHGATDADSDDATYHFEPSSSTSSSRKGKAPLHSTDEARHVEDSSHTPGSVTTAGEGGLTGIPPAARIADMSRLVQEFGSLSDEPNVGPPPEWRSGLGSSQLGPPPPEDRVHVGIHADAPDRNAWMPQNEPVIPHNVPQQPNVLAANRLGQALAWEGAEELPENNNNNNDVNAFLELVGIHGPLENLAQNVTMVLLVIVVALSIGCLWPYTTGRFVMWILHELYQPSVEWSLRQLQRLTDPILDPVVDATLFGAKLIGLVSLSASNHSATAGAHLAKHILPSSLISANLSKLGNAGALLSSALSAPNESETVNVCSLHGYYENSLTGLSIPSGDAVFSFFDQDSKSQLAHPSYHSRERRTFISDAWKGKRIMGIPDTIFYTLVGYVTHFVFLLDYARRTGLLEHPYMRTVRLIITKWTQYTLLAIKFSFLLTIELGIFPFFCGVLIDLCTLSVFGPRATVASRLKFQDSHRWTSGFLHWLAGTTFMFQFALYVSTIRKIVRPGVMWCIRDPNDPQFHPMNDILERPILLQLKKLAVGTLQYAIMVLGGVGGTIGIISCWDWLAGNAGPAKIFPLQWDLSIPISEFPLDLLVFHFIIPWTIATVKPKKLLAKLLEIWFRWAAHRLRLSSFMFGGNHKDEESDDEIEIDVSEGTEDMFLNVGDKYDMEIVDAPSAAPEPLNGTTEDVAKIVEDHGEDGDDEWEDEEIILLNSSRKSYDVIGSEPRKRRIPRRAVRFMRVPNHDHVEVKPGLKMLIPMRYDEEVFGREGETEEEVKANWTRVYVPDRFKARLIGLLLCQWICGIFLVSLLIAVPLVIGRICSTQITRRLTEWDLVNPANNRTMAAMELTVRKDLPIHDVYSYGTGVLLVLVTVFFVLKLSAFIQRLRKVTKRSSSGRRHRSIPDVAPFRGSSSLAAVETIHQRPKRSWVAESKKLLRSGLRKTARSIKVTFLIFMICIVCPLLIGLVFDLYLIKPFGFKNANRVAATDLATDQKVVRSLSRAVVHAILQDWALGAVYMKIAWALIIVGPDTEVRRILTEFARRGPWRVRVAPIWTAILSPLITVCLGLLGGPGVLAFVLPKATVSRWLFPGLLLLTIITISVGMLFTLLRKWMDHVREEEFLVGRKLHNLDASNTEPTPTAEPTTTTTTTTGQPPADVAFANPAAEPAGAPPEPVQPNV
ncbi:hypothetical protein DFS34DRAFT_618303 [Phlyctochytrium arcticum]|nr:hypothetical protein DFS34DRAFT_618303 [Phlyctochytrium arcticum]